MGLAIEEVEIPPVHGLAIRATLPIAELPRFFGSAYHELAQAACAAGASFCGPPFARYFSLTPDAVEVEAVMPVEGAVQPSGRVYVVELPAGHAAQAKHVGPYEGLAGAYQEIDAWLMSHHRNRGGVTREVYLTDPAQVPDPARWETLVVQPIV